MKTRKVTNLNKLIILFPCFYTLGFNNPTLAQMEEVPKEAEWAERAKAKALVTELLTRHLLTLDGIKAKGYRETAPHVRLPVTGAPSHRRAVPLCDRPFNPVSSRVVKLGFGSLSQPPALVVCPLPHSELYWAIPSPQCHDESGY